MKNMIEKFNAIEQEVVGKAAANWSNGKRVTEEVINWKVKHNRVAPELAISLLEKWIGQIKQDSPSPIKYQLDSTNIDKQELKCLQNCLVYLQPFKPALLDQLGSMNLNVQFTNSEAELICTYPYHSHLEIAPKIKSLSTLLGIAATDSNISLQSHERKMVITICFNLANFVNQSSSKQKAKKHITQRPLHV
jgi:hypothetical protein